MGTLQGAGGFHLLTRPPSPRPPPAPPLELTRLSRGPHDLTCDLFRVYEHPFQLSLLLGTSFSVALPPGSIITSSISRALVSLPVRANRASPSCKVTSATPAVVILQTTQVSHQLSVSQTIKSFSRAAMPRRMSSGRPFVVTSPGCFRFPMPPALSVPLWQIEGPWPYRHTRPQHHQPRNSPYLLALAWSVRICFRGFCHGLSYTSTDHGKALRRAGDSTPCSEPHTPAPGLAHLF